MAANDVDGADLDLHGQLEPKRIGYLMIVGGGQRAIIDDGRLVV